MSCKTASKAVALPSFLSCLSCRVFRQRSRRHCTQIDRAAALQADRDAGDCRHCAIQCCDRPLRDADIPAEPEEGRCRAHDPTGPCASAGDARDRQEGGRDTLSGSAGAYDRSAASSGSGGQCSADLSLSCGGPEAGRHARGTARRHRWRRFRTRTGGFRPPLLKRAEREKQGQAGRDAGLLFGGDVLPGRVSAVGLRRANVKSAAPWSGHNENLDGGRGGAGIGGYACLRPDEAAAWRRQEGRAEEAAGRREGL